ncbi:MAG: hypothetical protein MJ002_08170, partial [Paludibacteraceae bacterium]|nr:hypothetical protein [Paludibacteraceae bacterium]
RGRRITQPGTYYDTLINVHGCDSIYKLVFNIAKTYYFRDTTQICDGETYNFRGRPITKAGIYRDTLPTVISGCDSIYEIYVKVAPKFHNIEYDTLCSNKTYHWRGKWLTESGVYFDSLKSSHGCDSVYEMRLTMYNPTVHEEYVEVCQGGSFDFRGRRITQPGTYYDTLINVHGCDSIYKLVFNVAKTYYFRDTTQICDGETYNFRGRPITKAGIYRDTLPTVISGCDSIYEIYVKVAPKFHNIEYDTLCSNKTYHWRGKWLTESGVYFDSLKSSHGCDSVYEMRLTMYNPTVHEEYVEVCQGGSFDFRGRRITQPGTYYDTLINVHGCDSIYKLVFNVAKTYYFRDTTQICDGETYNFRGRSITKAGTYRDTLPTVISGCDSIYEIYVKVAPKFHNIEYDTLCSNKTYHWRGKWFTDSGVYFDSLKGSQGCDSVYELRLEMNHSSVVEQYIEICEGDSFIYNGKIFTEPGTYYDTLVNSHGCDSIIKIIFNVSAKYHFFETIQICEGGVYKWHGKDIRFAGTYRDTLKTAVSSCDSIYELLVTVSPTFHNIEYDTVCSNNVYHWRGKWITEAGVYFDSLKNVQSCDSVYELRLAMFRPTITEQYIEVCEGGSFDFRGKRITEPGVYYDTLISVHGCDSIYKFVFNFTRTYYFRDTVMICDGDVYDFRGRNITLEGTYRDTLKTVNSGCDSIYELFVKVAPKFHNIEYDTVSSNNTYSWRGKWLAESGIYYDSLKSHFGCDSVYEMRLTMFTPSIYEKYVEVCEGTSYNFRGMVITEPGTYTDTLVTTHGYDSIFRLIINFVHKYYFRDTTYICDGQAYDFRGKMITHAGTYRDSLKTVACGCDSIYELYAISAHPFHDVATASICMNETYFWRGKSLNEGGTYYDTLRSHFGCDSVYELQLTVYRPSYHEEYVEVCSGGSFSFRGKLITQPGTYYDTLTNVHGCDSIYKLVFNYAKTYYLRDTVIVCDGDTYYFHGKAITQEGTYRDTLKTVVSGCDSIYEVFVFIAPKFHDIAYDTVCSNQTYHWRGKWLTHSGTYFDTLKSHFGCDSVYEFRLNMGMPSITEQYIEVCQGDSFAFRGNILTRPGIYYDTLVNKVGCDSIIKIVFNVTRKYHFYETMNICDGDTGYWRGKRIYRAGTYRDSLQTAESGCDSIYEVFVTMSYKFHHIDYDTVCSDSVYYWRGKWLTESGVYFDSILTRQGCDSVYELRLVMGKSTVTELYIEVCEGESFAFRGKMVTNPGVYYDTLISRHGCDSVIKFVFNVTRKYHFYDQMHLCHGDTSYWRGKKIYRAGIYRDSLQTVGSGCDSIYELNVTSAYKFHNIEYDTVCSNYTYRWRGKWLTQSGVYFDSLISSEGCDSVYELRLMVYANTETTIYERLCAGNVITFHGQRITQPGTYYDTLLRSGNGCDSVIKLVVSLEPDHLYETTAYICEGGSYTFFNQTCTVPGTYFHVVQKSAPLCDDTYKLILKTHETFHSIQDTAICDNDVLMFAGQRITAPGTYFDRYTSIYGCDSIYELRVSISHATYSTEHVSICSKHAYVTPTGKRINTSGVYYDTLLNYHGCDSIITYYLNAYDNSHVYDTLAICRGGSGIGISGVTFNAAGDYLNTVNRNPVIGCDTVFHTHVYYDNVYVTMPVTICYGHPFVFHGNSYGQTGIYTLLVTSQTPGVCDTVYTIDVTVNPVPHTVINDSTCDNKPYWFISRMLTHSGTYVDSSLRAANGCDSIITLNLVVHDSIVPDTLHISICEKDSFNWFGTWYKYDGVYHYTTIDPQCGCNIYNTLHLTTIKETRFISVNNVEMCQDEDEYFLTPAFSGTAPSRFTLRYDGVNAPSSNDLIDEWYDGKTIQVPIPRTADGNRIRPDNYTVNVQIGNAECGMGKQTLTFNLLVKYASSTIEQHFNDVISVLNDKFNGGYAFSDYRWYVNGQKVANANGSNLYNLNLLPNDVVYAELQRRGENYFIPTCPITIVDLSPEDRDYPIVVLSGRVSAQITAKEAATYRLCTVNGLVIKDGRIGKDEEIQLTLPYISGCYFLIVDAEEAGRKVFRLVTY